MNKYSMRKHSESDPLYPSLKKKFAEAFISPNQFKRFPKVNPRYNKEQRTKGRSCILTDVNEKKLLERTRKREVKKAVTVEEYRL